MSSALNEAEHDVFHSMKDFVLDYNAKLADMREVLSPTLTEAWDSVNETIDLDLEPITTIKLRSLIQCETNPKIAKVIAVFAVLIDEIKSLKHTAETQFFGPLTMYGHRMEPIDTVDAERGDAQLLNAYYKTKPAPPEEQMGAFLPVLQDLSNFIKRVQALASNYIAQLSSLYNEMNPMYLTTFKTVEFDYLFESLGELFTIVITIDNIIADNAELTNHWNIFQKMVQYVSGDIERFGIKKESDVSLMKQLITTINIRIMNVRLFEELLKYPYDLTITTGQSTLDDAQVFAQQQQQQQQQITLQQLQTPASKPPAAVMNHPILGNKTFANALFDSIQRQFNKVSTSLKDFIQLYTFDRRVIINCYALYALSKTLHSNVVKFDKSFYRSLWELQTTMPLVPLYARTSWYIADFLHIYARPPHGYDKDYFKPYLRNIPQSRKDVLAQQQEEFLPRMQIFYQQVGVWLVRLEGELSLTNVNTTLNNNTSGNNNSTNSSNNTALLTPTQLLHQRCNVLLHGVLLASQIRTTCISTLQLYLHTQQAFPKRTLYALFIAVELLKVIQIAYQRRMLTISEYYPHIVTFLTRQLLSILQPLHDKINRREGGVPSKLNSTKQDIHGALSILCTTLQNRTISVSTVNKPQNTNVDIILHSCLQIAQLQHLIKFDIQQEISLIVWKLTTLLQFNTIINTLCNCSFLYWISNAIGFILHDIFAASSATQGIDRVKYISLSARDCTLMLDTMTKPLLSPTIDLNLTPHVKKIIFNDTKNTIIETNNNTNNNNTNKQLKTYQIPFGKCLIALYEAEIRTYFRTKLILPLARYIETDLRLHIHSVVLQQNHLVDKYQEHQQRNTGGNIRSTTGGVIGTLDVKNFMLIAPFRLFNTLYNIKEQVENFLEHTFYNHNTLSLHDGKIYNDMKNLAINKYNLDFLRITMLPTSSHFSDSLDVLEIMRNIHIFVTRYNYNLHQQFFIEKSIDQKHLNVINIEHISTSIQTHGLGIMNTTVNFTYQFLTRKVVLIHEFLFDEHIKSPLLREMRNWRLHGKKEYQNKYPYTNAAKLYKELRRLGLNQSGLSYIDQLRLQITEIGNALGYVRLVRSGGLHVVAQNTAIIPSLDYDNLKQFNVLCETSGLSASTKQAGENFDQMLQNVINNLSEGTNYFYLLITIFRNIINLQENTHLQCFYMAIPMLVINYVESLMSKKEKLNNRNSKQEVGFCDDGFAVGIAYLLTLFNQDEEFDSIHWFDSVLEYLKSQHKQLSNEIEQAKKQKLKTYDFEHNTLNLQRQEAVITEYTSCYFSINSSRVFFRSAVELRDDLDKQKEKQQKEAAQDEDDGDDDDISDSTE